MIIWAMAWQKPATRLIAKKLPSLIILIADLMKEHQVLPFTSLSKKNWVLSHLLNRVYTYADLSLCWIDVLFCLFFVMYWLILSWFYR